ncbi:MAG: hypothetical protein BWY26_00568 [Elusimicrobia bacterium ADurb.Bin231]|nr:MAG: hypothetical protein BWY26_00568 [Elusimicrobia bacterium ADurb.Bin231]
MYKTITLRLKENDYKKILAGADAENRTISNFITHSTLKQIEESLFVDPIEMAEINSNKQLLKKIRNGHKDTKKMRGRMIG